MLTTGADVYSYAPDEDDMVVDPHLDKHLRHWGINMMTASVAGGGGVAPFWGQAGAWLARLLLDVAV